jgi:hypothetical protein
MDLLTILALVITIVGGCMGILFSFKNKKTGSINKKIGFIIIGVSITVSVVIYIVSLMSRKDIKPDLLTVDEEIESIAPSSTNITVPIESLNKEQSSEPSSSSILESNLVGIWYNDNDRIEIFGLGKRIISQKKFWGHMPPEYVLEGNTLIVYKDKSAGGEIIKYKVKIDNNRLYLTNNGETLEFTKTE